MKSPAERAARGLLAGRQIRLYEFNHETKNCNSAHWDTIKKINLAHAD